MGIIIWPVLVPAIESPTAVLFRSVKYSLIAKKVAEATSPNPKPKNKIVIVIELCYFLVFLACIIFKINTDLKERTT